MLLIVGVLCLLGAVLGSFGLPRTAAGVLALAAIGCVALFLAGRRFRSAALGPRPEEPYCCPRCGYDLRGVEGIHCPECGIVRPASLAPDDDVSADDDPSARS